MFKTFYFIRVDGVSGRTFATKRAAARYARKIAAVRVTVWFRDAIGQDIPVNWREVR